MNDGDAFVVECWQLGPTVINDPVWLRGASKGAIGWAEDYYIDTHWTKTSDLTAQGIPQCGGAAPGPSPTPTPVGGITTKERAAVNWAAGPHSQSYYGLCLQFVGDAYRAAGFPLKARDFTINGNTYPQQLWGHTSGGHTGNAPSIPPYGALVFFNANAAGKYDIKYSHVAISTGGGNIITGGDSIITSRPHSETLASRASARLFNTYVGWWLPDQ